MGRPAAIGGWTVRTSRSMVLVVATLLGLTACSTGARPRSEPHDPVSTSSPPVSVRLRPTAEMVRNLDYYFGGRDPLRPTVMSVLVSRGGRLLVERYYAQDGAQPHNIASVTKTVVSTLVGIAVDEGRLSLDDTLGELLPSYADSMTEQEAGVTLEHLLTMTAGFPGDPAPDRVGFDPAAPDWVGDILRRGLSEPVGHFAYSSATSHLLSAILQEATGRSVLEYAEDTLFGPLGIDTRGMTGPVFDPGARRAYDRARLAWPVDPQGRNLGFGLLKLRPRDLLRLGQLYLDHGRWRGRPVVSPDWVDRATSDHLEIRDPGGFGYGFQWWVGDLGGRAVGVAMGVGGQLVVVAPQLDLVVVTTSRITDPLVLDPGDLFDLVGDALVADR